MVVGDNGSLWVVVTFSWFVVGCYRLFECGSRLLCVVCGSILLGGVGWFWWFDGNSGCL